MNQTTSREARYPRRKSAGGMRRVAKRGRMRAILPLLAVSIVLGLPGALAQTGARMTPPSGPIVPLGPPVAIPLTIETDCGADAAPNGVHVQYSVTSAPAWAQVVVSPASDQMQYSECARGTAVFHAIATVTASSDAPAFVAQNLEVAARVTGSALGNDAQVRASVPIVAAYFSTIDAQATVTQRAVAPREIVTFPVTFTNFGNGNTKVSFDATEHDAGVFPVTPPPIILQSKQTGASDVAQVVNVQAYRMSTANGTTEFTLRYHSAYALDPGLKGDEGSITFKL